MRLSLRFKVSALVLMLVAPLSLFLYYTNIYSTNIVREKVAESASDTLTLHLGTLDELLEQTSIYLVRTANESTLLDLYAESNPDSVSYYVSIRKLMDQWYNDVSYYSIIRTVFVYHPGRDDLFLSSRKEYYGEMEAVREGLSPRMKTFDPPSSPKWDIVTVGGESVLFKALPDKTGRIMIGVLVSIDALAQPLTQLDSVTSDEKIGIVSKEGSLLWGKFSDEDLSRIRDIRRDASGPDSSTVRLKDGESYLYVGKPSLFSDLSVFILLDEKSLLDELPLFQRVIKSIPVAVVAILGIVLTLLGRIVFRPLQALTSGMRILGKGQLDYRLKEGKSKEFRIITQQFNRMAEQIGALKIDVYEEKMKGQQAELKHLQAQINPHFFMNSLNIVYHLVELKQYPLIKQMIRHLVAYFRFMMNTNDRWIALADEVAHIRNYMDIQMMMYPDKLSFDLQLPEELERTPLPPLLVQPFVENAFKHGFVEVTRPFKVAIVISREDGQDGNGSVVIRVDDSGPGFAPDRLNRLNEGIYEKEPTDRQLGIWNVRRRLAMYYAGRAELIFRNDACGGGSVEIRLPAAEEEENPLVSRAHC
ncbi:sensor histidine kinase [Cohnella fermenti]|uniref:sensor histidine kinase n=1 Tax=Cohnella fermenti TaxID=2565925 RepID=UPI001454BF6B|nr:histidine kinase [Cohnella fermenti]